MISLLLLFTLVGGLAAQPAENLPSEYAWQSFAQNPNQSILYKGKVQIGAYDSSLKCYKPYDRDRNAWGSPCDPPFPLPGEHRAAAFHFGVDQKKISERPKYTTNGGVEIGRDKAFEMLTADPTLEDDSAKLRVTVIGPPAHRKAFADAYHSSPLLARLRDGAIFREYDPDHWHVTDVNFVTSGKPTIYVQSPSGRVIHRQDDYSGPSDLEAIATALSQPADSGPSRLTGIRVADPNYHPSYDYDLRHRPIVGSGGSLEFWLCVVGLLALVAFFKK